MFRKCVYLFILAAALALGYGWAADTASAHTFQIGGDIQYRPTDQQIDASLADTLWPRQGYNNRNTSRSPFLSPYSPILEKKVSVPGFRPNRPIAGEDSRLYYEDSYNQLHAVEADGVPLWSIQLEGYAYGGLALAPDGTLYTLRSYPAVLYAIHPDGSIKWRYDIPSGNPGFFTPLLDKNGTIYVRSGGTIYAMYLCQ